MNNNDDVNVDTIEVVKNHPEYFRNFFRLRGIDGEGNQYVATGIAWERISEDIEPLKIPMTDTVRLPL